MKRILLPLLLLSPLALLAAPEAPPAVKALKGLDPVALTQGKEIAGKDDLALVHGRYRYHFATAASKAAFEKDPSRYEIQMAGSCARMGPLSGLGSPERFAVHDGRIYVFASEACRKAFVAAPAKFIEAPEAAPAGTDAQKQRGQELIKLALDGLGGAKHVDALTSLHWRITRTYKAKEATHKNVTTWLFVFPDACRRESSWHSGKDAVVLRGGKGFREDMKARMPLDASEVAFFRRELLRHPVAILRQRDRPGFQAVAVGKGKVGEAEVEYLAVALDGAVTTLGVDPKTGRVLRLRYSGRGADGIAPIDRVYSDFKECGKVVLPHAVHTLYDGEEQTDEPVPLEALGVDAKVDPRLFE